VEDRSVRQAHGGNKKVAVWTYGINAELFMFVDCFILLVALVWIYLKLRHDLKVIANEKWMFVHFLILFVSLGYTIYS